MAASTKVQLGARVAPEVKEAARTAAECAGQSLNVWVERTLAAALANGGRGEPGTLQFEGHETEPAPPRASVARRTLTSAEAKLGVKPIARQTERRK